MAFLDPTLVADRFTRGTDGRWLDLAIGERVRFRVMRALARAPHVRWLERCAALAGIWHPHIAAPIDFGALPDGRRFEASPDWRAAPTGSAGARRRALREARSFLHALGLSAGDDDPLRVREVNGGLALVCDDATGWPLAPPVRGLGGVGGGGSVVGARLQPRAALEWVIGLLESGDTGAPRSLALRASPGAGWRTFQGMVAREARVRGFVPVDARAAAMVPHAGALVAGRHVLLIEDRRDGAVAPCVDRADGVSDLLLGAGLRDLRGCVAVSAVPVTDPSAVDLDPVPVASLVRMVEGVVRSSVPIAELARRAGGNPGRFLQLVCGGAPCDRRVRERQPICVREARSGYASAPAGGGRAFVMRPRLLAQRRRALALVGRGRHAAAIRLLCALTAASDRRGDATTGDESALALGEVLLRRGRPRDASEWLDRAARAKRLETRVPGTVALACASVALGELSLAERLCRTAALVADRGRRQDLEAAARLTLARVLFWQGRYRDAVAELRRLADAPERRCPPLVMGARVALARNRCAEAGRLAAAALAAAKSSGVDDELAEAEAVLAALSATLADASGVQTHLVQAVAAGRRARLALAGIGARIEAAEGWIRSGRPDEGRALLYPLVRRRGALPPLYAARLNAVLGASGDAGAAAAADAFATSAGAALVRLSVEELDMGVIEEATGIMAACQEADAADAALEVACQRLLTTLAARSVAIVARDNGADTVLARAGSAWRCFDGGAARALATSASVGPSLGAAGIESAVAVRYGGRTIGAVTCRWPADARVDATRASALLSAAATACAPAVRAMLDARVVVDPGRSPAAVGLLGESPAIEHLRVQVAHAARAPFAVLIEGESGTGKELVARLIHEMGPRRGHGFCAVNCAALGDDLLEAELFGHARGAFTGAVAERAGLFEEADRGTLLLDEVSDLSPRAQAKLLRVIQEGEVRRVGENLPRRVDVRIVAATNRPLDEEASRGRFRADLRYRLDVIRIEVPPLRDRVDDVPLLAAHFWQQACSRTGRRAALGADVLSALARYDWPGNVRELQNVLASLAVHVGARARARAGSLPEHIARSGPLAGGTLDQARASFERRFVRAALARAGGHRGRAARALGMSRQGLAKLIKRLDLEAAG